MQVDHDQRSTQVDDSWTALWRRWGIALLSSPVMLAAYVLLPSIVPTLLASTVGFWIALAGASIVGGLAIALVSRALGLYRRDRGESQVDPQRQGITATQLALIAAWFLLPLRSVEQPLWAYLVAFVLVGLIGMGVFSLVAGRNARPAAEDQAVRPMPSRPAARSTAKVAPAWAQRVAAICLALGVLSLVRLALDGTSYFLWGGLALLAIGALLPTLIVLLGGGHDPRS